MLSIRLMLAAIVLFASSGFPASLLPRRSPIGQRIAAVMMLTGSALGLAGIVLSLVGGAVPSLVLAWYLPWGSFSIAVDPLSAFFLCLVFVVPSLGAVYGLGYWKQSEHEGNGQRLGLAYGLLTASMATVVMARDAVLFLLAWEVMALAAWFAATAEDDRPEVRKAGWIYLVATHIGTLVLFAMFAMWRRATASFALDPAQAMEAGTAATVFVLALVGFGFKAGFMPLHVWLPGAHANAPSHVSAVMSGVMLKMGIYGIIRMTGLIPVLAPWMGSTLLAVGAVTGIAGIAFAIGQQDLKRALAYSSIENIGIIGMAIGLALLGRSLGRGDWVLLGLGAALFHVWNHGLFKSLLFLDAGAVIHAAGSRNLDRMGGLGKRMPMTAALFVVGAVAIAGLPPLNGFSSEWLLYLGLFRTLAAEGPAGTMAAASAAVALAMIGALAVACFVRLLGAVFLGEPRGEGTVHAHDPSPAMSLPTLLLALACAFLGLFPAALAPFLEAAVGAWLPTTGQALAQAMPHIADLAPQGWISILGLALVLLVGALLLASRLSPRTRHSPRQGTWDCGYARPTARMEYTASSFGQSLVGLFSFILWPSRRGPRVEGSFPRETALHDTVPDPVLDRGLRPLFRFADRKLSGVRILQQGQTQLYILYILIIAILLLFSGGLGV